MTDKNVRAAQRRGAASRRGARGRAVARLLLGVGVKLPLLFVVASAAPACILPIAPEFQDPPGGPNAAPEISEAKPGLGDEVAAVMSQTFQFLISDPNPGDTLYVRWVVDYPPFVNNVSAIIPPSGPFSFPPSQLPAKIAQTVDCFSGAINTSFSRHRIFAVVADRDFAGSTMDYFALGDGAGKEAMMFWTLNLTCPMQPSP